MKINGLKKFISMLVICTFFVTGFSLTSARSSNDFVFKDSNVKYLTVGQLIKIPNKFQLAIARNEIYARHGYKIKNLTYLSKELQYYFQSQEWYRKIPGNNHVILNKVEEANVKLIQTFEKKYYNEVILDKVVKNNGKYYAIVDKMEFYTTIELEHSSMKKQRDWAISKGVAWYEQDGRLSADDGYVIYNPKVKKEKIRISASAYIKILKIMDASPEKVNLSKLYKRYGKDCGCPFALYVMKGKIVGMQQIYVP